MKNLPILTLVVVIGLAGAWKAAQALQPPATETKAAADNASAEPEQKADQPQNFIEGEAAAKKAAEVLTAARELLFTKPSIRTHLVQTVDLGDFQFKSEGDYRSGTGFRYKFQYAVKLAELEGRFMEISDGQILHTVRTLHPLNSGKDASKDEVEISRRDIQRIKKEIEKFLGNSSAEQSAEVALGGVPSILASLERCMQFDRVTEEALADTPVITLEGKWKETRKNELLAGIGNMGAQIAPFVPDLVRVAFDAQTKFPLRIQYLKKDPSKEATYVPIYTLAFNNIVYDEPVDPLDYSYLPPQGFQVVDDTNMFIEQIRQSAGAGTGTKPAIQ